MTGHVPSSITSSATREHDVLPSQPAPTDVSQLSRWGGAAGIAGFLALLASVIVVGALGLPDASDVETLTDFTNIEAGRIAEHFFYLGAVMLFALHLFVLYRLLRTTHPAAALFGTVMAAFGYVIMAASSLLHVSTSPLAALYDSADTPTESRQAIEYAWHGAQSVFDTMLATGVLLVPIGIGLLGLAMRRTPAFGSGPSLLAIALGAVGFVGAAIAVIDPGSMLAAAAVLVIAVFHLAVGWRTLALGRGTTIDLTEVDGRVPSDRLG